MSHVSVTLRNEVAELVGLPAGVSTPCALPANRKLFSSGARGDVSRAKGICAGCPAAARLSCLTQGVVAKETDQVRGGERLTGKPGDTRRQRRLVLTAWTGEQPDPALVMTEGAFLEALRAAAQN